MTTTVETKAALVTLPSATLKAALNVAHMGDSKSYSSYASRTFFRMDGHRLEISATDGHVAARALTIPESGMITPGMEFSISLATAKAWATALPKTGSVTIMATDPDSTTLFFDNGQARTDPLSRDTPCPRMWEFAPSPRDVQVGAYSPAFIIGAPLLTKIGKLPAKNGAWSTFWTGRDDKPIYMAAQSPDGDIAWRVVAMPIRPAAGEGLSIEDW